MIKCFNEFKHINEGLTDSYLFGCNFLYYTADYNKNEIIRTYKVLFDNGYRLGGRNTLEEVYERELKCTLLFIYPKDKKVLYADAGDYDGGYSPELIGELISSHSLGHDDWYLIKNRLEFNQLFKSTININDLLNNRKNVYESVLSNLEGPSIDEIYSKLGLNGLTPEKLFKKSIDNKFYYGAMDAIEKGYDINKNKDNLFYITDKFRSLSDEEMYSLLKLINLDNYDLDYLTERAHLFVVFNKLKCLELFFQNGVDANRLIEKKSISAWYEDNPEMIELLNKYKNIPVKKREKNGFVSKFKKFMGIDESVLSYLKGPSVEHILDNLMKKYEYSKKHGKGNIDQSYFVRLAIQSNNFFNYIGFIFLLIEDTSWYLGHDIISSAIVNNKLDVLKFTLDEGLYSNNKEQQISLLKRNLTNYKNHITDDMKDYIEGYIKKLESEK